MAADDPEPLVDARTEYDRDGPRSVGEARTIAAPPPSEAPTMAASPPVSAPLRRLGRGASVSRYVVLDLLGAGGMGVVYAAYDPELDRKVALKLLQVEGRNAGDLEARLRQEAQAMARLSHPNVVSVHDVGVHDGQIFLAMEMIDGATLRSWLSASPRSWPEIVAIFVQAGRGLAAAHAAGLVHRDFKPDNVLCTRDGRALVGDFGLARASDAPEQRIDDAVTRRDDETTRSGSLTRTGARMGTPAYMAPEQHLGVTVGPAADTFAFCVALYEALHGQHPFGGDTYLEIQVRVLEGVVREAPRGTRVPPRIHRALLRGLAQRPSDRPPTMDALLAELEAAARPRRRWLALVGGVVALATAGVLWTMSQRTDEIAPVDPAIRCQGIEATFDEAWGPTREAELRRAFAGSGLVYAGDVADRVIGRLDDHRARWIAARDELCRAHHVAGEISIEAYEQAAACFEGRRRRVERLVALLLEADPDAIREGVDVVDDLDPPEPCRDDAAIAASSADRVVHVDRRRAEIDAAIEDARGWTRARRFQPAIAAMSALVAELAPLGDTSERARAMIAWSGALYHVDRKASKERAIEAIALCWRAGDQRCVVDAVVEALTVIANDAGDSAMNEHLLGLGLAALARIGGDLRLEGLLRMYYCAGLITRGRYPEGLDACRDALALFRRIDDRLHIARTLKFIGSLDEMTGHYQEAVDHLREAVSILVQEFGADHPETGNALAGLAILTFRLGDYPGALDLTERQLNLNRRLYGERSRKVASVLANRAIIHLYAGDLIAAEEENRESGAIADELGTTEVARAEGLANLAEILRRKGDLAGAKAEIDRTLVLLAGSLPNEHPDWITAETIAGHITRQRGDLTSALGYYERALKRVRAAGLADNPSYIDLWFGLADLALRRRRPAEARAALAEVQALVDAGIPHPWDHANERFVRARLAEVDGDPTAAIAAARESIALFDGLMPGARFERDEVVRWLARRAGG